MTHNRWRAPMDQNLKQSFMPNTDAYRLLRQALLGLSGHVMGSVGECFKCTNWVMFTAAWDTFDELADLRTSHTTSSFVKICASSQPADRELLFWLRSRPRRSSMLETSSSLEERQNIIESQLCHCFYPPDSDSLWRSSYSYMAKHFELFKNCESSIHLETKKKNPFLSFSLCVTLCFTLLKTHIGPETKLINSLEE